MNPKEYTGSEWTQLLRRMDGRQIKRSLMGAIRREANKARKIAQARLTTSGLDVKGNTSDWKKGIRTRIYPGNKGTGFLVTVKARVANRKGGAEKSMHTNRFGFRKPVLMWAEEGTSFRRTKSQTRWGIRRRKSHSTGRMEAYRFLEDATPEMFNEVESGLVAEIDNAVGLIARKCGFL